MNLKKLNPLFISLLPPEKKGGDMKIKADISVWVCKNINGRYHGIYEVTPKSEMCFDSKETYGFLAHVDTPVASYFTSITNMDIIGSSKEDVEKKIEVILTTQKESARKRKEWLDNLELGLKKRSFI